MLAANVVHGLRVECHHLRTCCRELVDHVQRRCLSNVVRFGFECEPPQRNFLAVEVAFEVITKWIEQDGFLGIIGPHHAGQNTEFKVGLLAAFV